jgi:MFS family permease
MLFGGMFLAFVPAVAPSKIGFIGCLFLFNLCFGPLSTPPIIQDYVEKESYGKAQAFSLMGLSIGVIGSLSVVFEYSKDLDPQYSWGLMSILTIIFAFILLLIIDEPPEGIKREPVMQKVKHLTKT